MGMSFFVIAIIGVVGIGGLIAIGFVVLAATRRYGKSNLMERDDGRRDGGA